MERVFLLINEKLGRYTGNGARHERQLRAARYNHTPGSHVTQHELQEALLRLERKLLNSELPISLADVAAEFSVGVPEIRRRALLAFLENQFEIAEAERRRLCARNGVTSFEEFEKLLEEHPERESDMLEDFQHVDSLTYRIKVLSGWLEQMG